MRTFPRGLILRVVKVLMGGMGSTGVVEMMVAWVLHLWVVAFGGAAGIQRRKLNGIH